jgi:hypothetical protein
VGAEKLKTGAKALAPYILRTLKSWQHRVATKLTRISAPKVQGKII